MHKRFRYIDDKAFALKYKYNAILDLRLALTDDKIAFWSIW